MFKKIIKFILIAFMFLVLMTISLYSCLFFRLDLLFVPIIFVALILSIYLSKILINKTRIFLIKLKSDDDEFKGGSKNKLIDAFNLSLNYTKKYNKENSEKLPWFFMLGDSQSAKTSLLNRSEFALNDADDSDIIASNSKYGYCWDNKDLIIAELSSDIFLKKPTKESIKSWEFLLKKIKSNSKNILLKGIVIAVSVNQLKGDEKDLTIYAVNLRKKIDYCSKVLGYNFPIYVLVTNCDAIQGFDGFASSLPNKITDQPFGELFAIDNLLSTDALLNNWTTNIVERIRAFNTLSLQANSVLMPRALLLEKKIVELQSRLSLFIDSFFNVQNINKSDTPKLRGLFLTSASQSKTSKEIDANSILDGLGLNNCYRHNNKKLYVGDIFSKILTKDTNFSTKLSYKLNRVIKYKRRLLVVWWSIFICGTVYLAISYMQTIKVLNKILISTDVVSERFNNNLSDNLKLIRDMDNDLNKIIAIKNNNKLLSWPYTSALLNAEENYKKKYVQKFNKYIIKDLTAETIKDVEFAKKYQNNKYIGNIAEILLQSIQIIQSKLNGLPYDDINSINVKETLINDNVDENNYGDLYKKYLFWNDNVRQLQTQKSTMESLLKNLDVFNENPDWIINWANNAYYNKEIKITDYWPQGYANQGDETNIEAAYQHDTNIKIVEVLSNLARESAYPKDSSNYISYFMSEYNIKRNSIWKDFTSKFNPNSMTVPTKAAWVSILKDRNPGYTYINYAKTIRNNFDNEDFQNKKPEWVKLTIKLEPYFAQSLIISDTSGFTKSWWQKIQSYIDSYYTNIDNNNIWDYNSKILNSINDYQNELAKTKNLVEAADDLTSFETMESLMYKDDGSDISKGIKQTAKDYDSITEDAKKAWPQLSVNNNDIVWNLYRNGLNILTYGITQNAMCYISDAWQDTIINDDGVISNNDNIDQWFSGDSLISEFMKNNVRPFVKYDTATDGFVSKEIYGQSMQFSDFTYKYLNSELYYKKIKAIETQISAKLTASGENITIKTDPTNLNAEAKILPYSTTFKFICNGQTKSFTNYNTRYDFIIPNDILTCTESSININFNGTNEFTVSKKYYGNDSVLQMMNAFIKDKNITLETKDLSGDVNLLQNYDITSIDVDMNFGDLGLYDLLTEYSNYRSKMMTNISDIKNIKITNCWNSQQTSFGN